MSCPVSSAQKECTAAGGNGLIAPNEVTQLSYSEFSKRYRKQFRLYARRINRQEIINYFEFMLRDMVINQTIQPSDVTRLYAEGIYAHYHHTLPMQYEEDKKNAKFGIDFWSAFRSEYLKIPVLLSTALQNGKPITRREFFENYDWRINDFDLSREYTRWLVRAKRSGNLSMDQAVDLINEKTDLSSTITLWQEFGYEVTRSEFMKQAKNVFPKAISVGTSTAHENSVRRALDLGMVVSSEVMADYPDLCPHVLGEAVLINKNRESVERALKAGLPVPIETLLLFPDLLAQYGA